MLLLCESYLMNVFKHFLQIGLNCERFLGLREDLKELVVTKEIKSGKLRPLAFQVVIERFLNVVKGIVALFNLIQQVINLANFDHIWVVPSSIHDSSPKNISMLKVLALLMQLLCNIG
jgi:hypothetical protein